MKLTTVAHEYIHCTCPSGCKKNYCVCLKAGARCNDNCHCAACENDNRPEAKVRRERQLDLRR